MKNIMKLFGLIALTAVIGFSLLACGGGGGGGGGRPGGGTPPATTITYTSYDGNDTEYKLKVDKAAVTSVKRAYQPVGGDTFTLTITPVSGSPTTITGTVDSVAGAKLVLVNSEGDDVSVNVSGNAIASFSGPIPVAGGAPIQQPVGLISDAPASRIQLVLFENGQWNNSHFGSIVFMEGITLSGNTLVVDEPYGIGSILFSKLTSVAGAVRLKFTVTTVPDTYSDWLGGMLENYQLYEAIPFWDDVMEEWTDKNYVNDDGEPKYGGYHQYFGLMDYTSSPGTVTFYRNVTTAGDGTPGVPSALPNGAVFDHLMIGGGGPANWDGSNIDNGPRITKIWFEFASGSNPGGQNPGENPGSSNPQFDALLATLNTNTPSSSVLSSAGINSTQFAAIATGTGYRGWRLDEDGDLELVWIDQNAATFVAMKTTLTTLLGVYFEHDGTASDVREAWGDYGTRHACDMGLTLANYYNPYWNMTIPQGVMLVNLYDWTQYW